MLAHEVSHIRNRDTYLMTMATVFAGVIALVGDIGFRSIAYGGRRRGGGALVAILAIVGLILAPYAALLLRMSLSRRREFLADAGAAELERIAAGAEHVAGDGRALRQCQRVADAGELDRRGAAADGAGVEDRRNRRRRLQFQARRR